MVKYALLNDGNGTKRTSTSLSQQAYRQIRERIVTLDMPPGSVIDRSALEEELDLGRTPIREALQRLAWEKLVTIVPRRGMFVTDIGISDPKWLFEVRRELDKLAARLAARRGKPSHWRQMEAILSDLPSPSGVEKREMLVAIDEACHEIIYEAADNEFLRDTLLVLYGHSVRLWYFYLYKIDDMREAMREHERILEPLKVGDADLAAERIEEHLLAFQEALQAAMLDVPIR